MPAGDVLHCPQCGHESYIILEYFPATRVGLSNAGDPESWSGRCQCRRARQGVLYITDYQGVSVGDCECSYEDY